MYWLYFLSGTPVVTHVRLIKGALRKKMYWSVLVKRSKQDHTEGPIVMLLHKTKKLLQRIWREDAIKQITTVSV